MRCKVIWSVLKKGGKGTEGQWALKRTSHSVVVECYLSPLSHALGFDRAVFDSLILAGIMQATCTLDHTKFCGWIGSTTQKHTRCKNSLLLFHCCCPV